MALLHQAQLHPTKLELLSEWAPTQSWFVGQSDAELTNVAAFRFDDPAGEVGVETILIRAGDSATMQVPVTYRGAPLEGAEAHIIGTMEHSVLGKRWVYDGAGDPVYLQVTATAALNGDHQAELFVQTESGRIERTPNALVSGTGTGSATVELPEVHEIVVSQKGVETDVVAGALHLRIHRVFDGDEARGIESDSGSGHAKNALVGTWIDSPQPRELVVVSRDE